MNYISFVLASALSDLFRNKLRTFLTSLGILIGVASVVLLLAFGLGLKEFIRQQFDSLGTNLVFVLPGRIFGQGGGFQATGALGGIKFDEKDLRPVGLRVHLGNEILFYHENPASSNINR